MPKAIKVEAGERVAVRLKGYPDILIEVEVLEIKAIFGRQDLRVKPVAGTGEQWISAERIVR